MNEDLKLLWEDYHDICDLFGYNSSQAEQIFAIAWSIEELYIRKQIDKVWKSQIRASDMRLLQQFVKEIPVNPEDYKDIQDWKEET